MHWKVQGEVTSSLELLVTRCDTGSSVWVQLGVSVTVSMCECGITLYGLMILIFRKTYRMGLWSQEVMNKTLSSCTNQLCDLKSYLNSLAFNFLVYKTGHKMDCFREQFEGCSRNVLLLLLSSLPSFLFFHPSFRFYCFPALHLHMFFGKDSET